MWLGGPECPVVPTTTTITTLVSQWNHGFYFDQPMILSVHFGAGILLIQKLPNMVGFDFFFSCSDYLCFVPCLCLLLDNFYFDILCWKQNVLFFTVCVEDDEFFSLFYMLSLRSVRVRHLHVILWDVRERHLHFIFVWCKCRYEAIPEARCKENRGPPWVVSWWCDNAQALQCIRGSMLSVKLYLSL